MNAQNRHLTVEEVIRDCLARGMSKTATADELSIRTCELNEYLLELGIQWPKVHHTSRPGVMPSRIGRNKQRIEAIEGEYGMPIAELLASFADDGESRYATAQILMVPYATFRKWPEVKAIQWAVNNDANGHKTRTGHPGRRTPAIVEAANNNLARARETRWPQEHRA